MERDYDIDWWTEWKKDVSIPIDELCLGHSRLSEHINATKRAV